MKTEPDKMLWDEVNLPDDYEYIQIPKQVLKTLKRESDGFTLLCYSKKDKYGEKTYFMCYEQFDGHTLRNGGGYCFSLYDGDTFETKAMSVAEDIAQSWPNHAVKHRGKK